MPDTRTCTRLGTETLPRLVPDPRRLQRLLAVVDDPPLRAALSQDIQTKWIIVGGCATGRAPKQEPGIAETSSRAVAALLLQIGIRL